MSVGCIKFHVMIINGELGMVNIASGPCKEFLAFLLRIFVAIKFTFHGKKYGSILGVFRALVNTGSIVTTVSSFFSFP